MRKCLELRQRALDELGDAFDIKAFRNLVLGSGSVPLDILERVVRTISTPSWAGALRRRAMSPVLAWLGRIVPSQLAGSPPVRLESYTTLRIQVLYLGVIVSPLGMALWSTARELGWRCCARW